MNRLFFFLSLFLPQTLCAQGIKLLNLRCEYRTNPQGIENPAPRLSWELQSSHRGVTQSAWRILVSEDSLDLVAGNGTRWDSKKQYADRSIGTAYAGPALAPARTYYWRVMVWDSRRQDSSSWSPIASWQTGLFTAADWKGAQWIGFSKFPDSLSSQHRRDTLPLFRKTFTISKLLKRAMIFISGLGHFEMTLNGKLTGDHFLDPGWTNYEKEALYVPFDITAQLQQGPNSIGVMLGNGFYYIPRERYHKLLTAYGYPKMIVRIALDYQDGTQQDIVSDPSWRTAPSPILYSSIYGGEDVDARLERKGWDSPGFDDSGWRYSRIVEGPTELHAQSEEPLKVFEHFAPRQTTEKSAGIWIYDLGQNASGIPEIQLKGKKGATVRIIPAELLNADTTVHQRASGSPYYWEYTLKGEDDRNGIETWQPRFSYYGFRYLQVEGAVPEGRPNAGQRPVIVSLVGLHTRNAAERTGKFTCSNELLRRTDSLIDWAIQSNMASVLTDCPHREKLGWLEQAHLMGSSIRYGYDIASLYRKIIRDMIDAQTPEGLIPEIAPEFVHFGDPFRDSPEWGSSSILVPWYLYCWYGDRRTLEESYPLMQRYLGYLGRQAKDHILDQGLGDWYDIGPARPGFSQNTPKGVTATAIYYYDLSILQKIAALLGKPDDATRYAQDGAAVKEAFLNKFFNRQTAQVASGSQTANAMALYVGLVPAEYKDSVLASLVKDIRRHNNSLTTGDIGYRYLLCVLQEAGRQDLIFQMNSRSDVPGYGYQLARGATALTESWQALPSVSNDHLMLGHLMEWFYEGLAGIRSDDSDIAFHKIIVRPSPVGNIQWAQADYHSPYGSISSHWKVGPHVFDLSITIPGNTTATVYLPARSSSVITESWKNLAGRPGIRVLRMEKGLAVLGVGSGSYYFRVQDGNAVSEKKMAEVYEAVKTPFKYGLVMTPPDSARRMDCPSIFHKGKEWYMTYILFDGRGYETWLAKSADLLHWQTQGRILSFTDSSRTPAARAIPASAARTAPAALWDSNQKAGYISLEDPQWGGSYQLQPFKGKYWMSYFGGNSRGYETGMLSEGIAFTTKDPAIAHEWKRLDHPVLTVKDPNVAWWDNHTLYKSWVLWDKSKTTGHSFLMYYNANGDSVNRKRGSERIGMAVSDDMTHWKRLLRDPVLDHLTGITGDPYIQKMEGLWVMFYFGAFWNGTHGAFNRFACSYDLVHWTDWTGPDLIEPSEPYDEVFAHKSFVINYKGTVYHFYCAVDKKGNRGIALATSADKGKSELSFH
jgi:alpha-L-rhamnosidase